MTHPFASPLFRLARLWPMRVLVCVLALSIAFSGFAAAAMPLHAAVATPTAHDACAQHAPAQKPGHLHGSNDSCCNTACACAFAHVLGLAAAMPLAAHGLAGASMPVPLRKDIRRQNLSPPLRPPIA